jgi:hypothetical protein
MGQKSKSLYSDILTYLFHTVTTYKYLPESTAIAEITAKDHHKGISDKVIKVLHGL